MPQPYLHFPGSFTRAADMGKEPRMPQFKSGIPRDPSHKALRMTKTALLFELSPRL